MHYKICKIIVFAVAIHLSYGASASLAAGKEEGDTSESKLLWRIGETDGDYAEFALAPNGYTNYKNDGFFVIGTSDPKIDWPYVQPGPQDAWAGSKTHTNTIVFGLRKAQNEQNEQRCMLFLDLVDTQAGTPPKLEVSVNGTKYFEQLPFGGGDESINGNPKKGAPFQLKLEFPDSLLLSGTNTIQISNINGSWLLFDAISLYGTNNWSLDRLDKYIATIGIEVENALMKENEGLYRLVNLELVYAGARKKVRLRAQLNESKMVWLIPGKNSFLLKINGDMPLIHPVTFDISDKTGNLWSKTLMVNPVKHRTIYILPHSHTDIGYTEIQTAIEDKQVQNLVTGMEDAWRTSSYPDGSRFVWNVEVGWAADLYLNRMNEKQKFAFVEAVKSGQVALNGMYLNELTGLCRPEELLRLFKFSKELEKLTGQTIDAAMISDVPGYTWGTVTALAQAGIKYFSVAPNFFDRIGDILKVWENKPFYWVSPSGHDKVLVWIPIKGYAMSHIVKDLNDQTANDFLKTLDDTKFPYDIAYMRWSGHGDNAAPDPSICEFVKDWNKRYAWPKFIISSTSEAFSAFEKKYGDDLPEFSGDWTPYWEDGAGSSALQTAMNRNSSDRLSQAQTLFALSDPAGYPVEQFEEAWRNVLLYSEHTWGAWCSITDPENKLTLDQWAIKKSYADSADSMSKNLLGINNIESKNSSVRGRLKKFTVVNTCSWDRSGLVEITQQSPVWNAIYSNKKLAGLKDHNGEAVALQLLTDSTIVFMADNVKAFGTEVYYIVKHNKAEEPKSWAVDGILRNANLMVNVDPESGNISYLGPSGENFINLQHQHGFNEYLFMEGTDLSGIQTQGKAIIHVKENGPIVKSIEITSSAPGTKQLIREIKLIGDQDYIEIVNTIDKTRAPMPKEIGNWSLAQNENKESINFAFPFNLPDGVMHIDIPLGEIVPWKDQLPSGCKNWFTVGRYVDISNAEKGVSWVTLDAPLIEVGEISATLAGSQTNPEVWRKKVDPTQTFYSWAMNNHWGTNYRQHQEGIITFRYAVRPHDTYDAADAYRFATALSQPLLAIAGDDFSDKIRGFNWSNKQVVALAVKPADAGKGTVFTLYNPTDKVQKLTIDQNGDSSVMIYESDTSEKPLKKLSNPLTLQPKQVRTVLCE